MSLRRRSSGGSVDGRLLGPQRVEPGVQALHPGRGEAGADPADVAQPAVLRLGQQQRPDAARRLGRAVADDQELLALPALDLEPAPGAHLLVGGIGALRDHALEPELRGLLEERAARYRRTCSLICRAELGVITGSSRPSSARLRSTSGTASGRSRRDSGRSKAKKISSCVRPSASASCRAAKLAMAPLVLDHDLAVDQRLLAGQSPRRPWRARRSGRSSPGPIG